jgi:hypothetical protein
VLAARIRRLRDVEPDAPVVIHLDGPWGSGKSTVLNFLEDSISAAQSGERGWMVLRYNAWQQQRIDTPWWTLATQLIDAMTKDLFERSRYRAAFTLAWRNYFFKALSTRTWVAVSGLVAFGIGLLLLRYSIPSSASADAALKVLAAGIKDLLSVVLTVFGIVLATSRFLTASDTSAQDYLKSRTDPLGNLANHLKTLVESFDKN